MKQKNCLDILSDKKIICADDEAGFLHSIVDILEIFFEEVISVSNGQELLTAMENVAFDVLLTDINMPKIDGLIAIEKIRSINKKIPIIILSAHTGQKYLWKAVNMKISKFLAKPFDNKEFLDALAEVAKELVDYRDTVQITSDCIYTPCSKSAIRNGNSVHLSRGESRLLEYFVRYPEQVVSYDSLIDYMWINEQPTKEAVKSIVKDLRRKVGSNFLKNIYGIGYTYNEI